VWAALITVYVVWGSTYLAIREAIDTIPPFLMASVRFLIAGGLLYAISIRRGDRVADRPAWPQWRSAIIVGGLLLCGGNGGVSWVEQHVPSGATALLIATIPLWMVVIGFAAFRERVGARETVGVGIGFGGIALLALAGSSGDGGGHLDTVGVVVALFAAACWATGSLYARRAPLPSRPLVSTAMQMLTGGLLLAIISVATGEPGKVDLSRISLSSVLGLVYLIVFGSLVAFSAYVWLLRNARLSLVATYPYVNPVVAVFLGWAFLSERVTLTTFVAGAIIVVAVALIVSASHRPKAVTAEEAVAAPEPRSGGVPGDEAGHDRPDLDEADLREREQTSDDDAA
jgi:drug/metabolite transporter (DMT)-like permease